MEANPEHSQRGNMALALFSIFWTICKSRVFFFLWPANIPNLPLLNFPLFPQASWSLIVQETVSFCRFCTCTLHYVSLVCMGLLSAGTDAPPILWSTKDEIFLSHTFKSCTRNTLNLSEQCLMQMTPPTRFLMEFCPTYEQRKGQLNSKLTLSQNVKTEDKNC